MTALPEEVDVADLGLPAHTERALLRNRVSTAAELVPLLAGTDPRLLDLRGVGMVGYVECVAALDDLGVPLPLPARVVP